MKVIWINIAVLLLISTVFAEIQPIDVEPVVKQEQPDFVVRNNYSNNNNKALFH